MFLTRPSYAEPRSSNTMRSEEVDSFEKKTVKAPILKTYKLSTTQGPLIGPNMTLGRAPQDRGAYQNHIILGRVLD